MRGQTPMQFLKRLERLTGRKIPVPPQRGEDDDCPICRALGMTNGPVDGITTLNGKRILTIVTKERRPPK